MGGEGRHRGREAGRQAGRHVRLDESAGARARQAVQWGPGDAAMAKARAAAVQCATQLPAAAAQIGERARQHRPPLAARAAEATDDSLRRAHLAHQAADPAAVRGAGGARTSLRASSSVALVAVVVRGRGLVGRRQARGGGSGGGGAKLPFLGVGVVRPRPRRDFGRIDVPKLEEGVGARLRHHRSLLAHAAVARVRAVCSQLGLVGPLRGSLRRRNGRKSREHN